MSEAELNKLNEKAALALGWTKEKPYWSDKHFWYRGDGEYDWIENWNPCADWNDAAVLIEHLRQEGNYMLIAAFEYHYRATYGESFHDYMKAETAPKAITLAFLKAKGVSVDG